jgi:cyanophycinase-like exopeptidase
MNEGQPIYLFAGGRGKTIFSTFKVIGKVVKSLGKQNPVIAIVGVASLRDNPVVSFMMAALLKTGVRCRIKRAVIASPDVDMEKAKKILREADIIFLGGGDAEEGVKILREKNLAVFLQDLIRQGKPTLGVSAGTIMMCGAWVRWQDPDDDATCELHACLGIVPIICDTHAEGDNWVELKAALKLKDLGTVGYGITSGAYLKAFPDGRLEACAGTVVRYTNKDGKIERLPDLLPVNNPE